MAKKYCKELQGFISAAAKEFGVSEKEMHNRFYARLKELHLVELDIICYLLCTQANFTAQYVGGILGINKHVVARRWGKARQKSISRITML